MPPGRSPRSSPRVQTLAAPVRRGEEWYDDLVPLGGPVLVILVVKRVSDDVLPEGASVGSQFLFGELFVATNELTGIGVATSLLTDPVLDGLHLHVVPIGPEGRDDPTVMGHVPVPVCRSLPDAQRSQVGGCRLATCHWLIP